MEQQLQIVKAYIVKHLKDELSLDAIANEAGYSAYHFAREFKSTFKVSVMEFTRLERLSAARNDLADGRKVIDVAMDYGFDTHAGFTKAFTAEFGCTPTDYAAHAANKKGNIAMKLEATTKIAIRPLCRGDVNDLWENVYSAMTPRQITENKILPMIELEQHGEGIELVAAVDGIVVSSLPMKKAIGLPLGVLFDNYFNWDDGDYHILMRKTLDEMKRQCRMMNITTLMSPQYSGSAPVEAWLQFGFTKAFSAGGWDYLMLAI
jgi:AraC-like DNA-binding protein